MMNIKRMLFLSACVVAASLCIAAESPVKIGSGKNWIDTNTYFTYEYDKKPSMGVVIAKIKVFDKNGARNNEFSITGKSGMVSMRAHDTGDVLFKQNKKGDYLLPVDVAMPGEWYVKVSIMKKKAKAYTGVDTFNVE